MLVPVRILMGRFFAPEYLAALEAPEKEVIWFEQSAHMLPFEEPEKFNEAVRQFARRVGLLEY